MKTLVIFWLTVYCLLLFRLDTFCQTPGEWTWMKGANFPNQAGIYGTMGVAAPANVPGGRYESYGMTDSLGNFWLFGGSGIDCNDTLGLLNDLWKYAPSTNNWTFMKGDSLRGHLGVYGTKGMPSPANKPGQRFAGVSWNQVNGALWLWGGNGYNDLWKYDIATNDWTWMTGSNVGGAIGVYGTKGVAAANNTPGQRGEVTTSWVDNNGNLWLFGGSGYAAVATYGLLNDLWMYNTKTNLWTWVSGDNVVNQAGVYGTLGVSSPANKPGARQAYSSWTDLQSNLWTFGGYGVSGYSFNDLWKYDVGTNEWTWMSGSKTGSTVSTGGLYVAKCSADSMHIPSRRFENKANWVDLCGNFWSYGGGNTVADLWSYNPSTHQWTWASGDTTTNTAAVYGIQGVSNPLNKPGGRCGAPSWRHKDGSLWIFGGIWMGNPRDNALFRYVIDPNCGGSKCVTASKPVANFQCSDTTFCSETGKCINFYDHSTGNPTSWQWIFNGASPNASTQQNPDSICYNAPGTYPVTLIVSNSLGSDTLAVASLIVNGTAPLPPTINVIGGDTLISSHGASYQWFRNGLPIGGATDSFYVATQGGTYSVQIADGLGCNSLSGGTLITGMLSTEYLAQSIGLYPNPVSDEVTITFPKDLLKSKPIITDVVGQRLDVAVLNQSSTSYSLVTQNLREGLYFLQINIGEQIINRKFIIVHK